MLNAVQRLKLRLMAEGLAVSPEARKALSGEAQAAARLLPGAREAEASKSILSEECKEKPTMSARSSGKKIQGCDILSRCSWCTSSPLRTRGEEAVKGPPPSCGPKAGKASIVSRCCWSSEVFRRALARRLLV
jgi:hypothetical protein